MSNCIICAAQTAEGDLCGPQCAADADDQGRANVARMRTLHSRRHRTLASRRGRLRDDAGVHYDTELYALAYRNGRLTSALLAYGRTRTA